MASKLQFTTDDDDEIMRLSSLLGQSLPVRRDGGWWEATAVRHSSKGLTVWATSAEPPTCGKFNCEKSATKLLTVSDGQRVQVTYRCDPCAKDDEKLVPRVQPWCTVTVEEVQS